MLGVVAARARAQPVGDALSWVHARLGLAAIALCTLAIAPTSPRADATIGLAATTRRESFSIVKWEIGAFAERARSLVTPVRAEPADDLAAVHAHFANVAEISRLRQRRGDLFARGADTSALEADLAARQARFDVERARVEAIVAQQMETIVDEQRLREGLLNLVAGEGWPVPFLRIDPGILFSYRRLPMNLVVASRDRIGIVGSVLVSPDLTTADIERLERRVDGTGVSSIVSEIGGLGTYPSMVPDTDTLERGLDVIGHEWAHHYLAFRPLGRAFFDSYDMRSINETVADIVGHELGALAASRYYGRNDAAGSRARATPRPVAPARDFGTEMRRIRREVEQLLAAGDVAAAERHMAAQRDALSEMGWQIRKLNTAYLSFFGAYSGGANRFEAPLRELRQRSGSLADFLRQVETIGHPGAVGAAR